MQNINKPQVTQNRSWWQESPSREALATEASLLSREKTCPGAQHLKTRPFLEKSFTNRTPALCHTLSVHGGVWMRMAWLFTEMAWSLGGGTSSACLRLKAKSGEKHLLESPASRKGASEWPRCSQDTEVAIWLCRVKEG